MQLLLELHTGSRVKEPEAEAGIRLAGERQHTAPQRVPVLEAAK